MNFYILILRNTFLISDTTDIHKLFFGNRTNGIRTVAGSRAGFLRQPQPRHKAPAWGQGRLKPSWSGPVREELGSDTNHWAAEGVGWDQARMAACGWGSGSDSPTAGWDQTATWQELHFSSRHLESWPGHWQDINCGRQSLPPTAPRLGTSVFHFLKLC